MTRLVDDIDGSHAVTTLSFGLDGRSYEIDLSESHLSAFRQALAPFITAARALPHGHPAATPRRAPAPKEPAVATGAGNVAEEATPPPTAHPTEPSTVHSQPFQQASPTREAAAPARPAPVPLVADPFNPRS